MRALLLTILFYLMASGVFGQSPAFIEQISDTHPLYNLTTQQRYSVVHQMQVGSYNRSMADVSNESINITQFQFGRENTSIVTSLYPNNTISTFQYGRKNHILLNTMDSQQLGIRIFQFGNNHNAYIKTNNSIEVVQYGRDTEIIIESH